MLAGREAQGIEAGLQVPDVIAPQVSAPASANRLLLSLERKLLVRKALEQSRIGGGAVLEALSALAPLNRDVREVMAARLERRRARDRERIAFLDPDSTIPRTKPTVSSWFGPRSIRSPTNTAVRWG